MVELRGLLRLSLVAISGCGLIVGFGDGPLQKKGEPAGSGGNGGTLVTADGSIVETGGASGLAGSDPGNDAAVASDVSVVSSQDAGDAGVLRGGDPWDGSIARFDSGSGIGPPRRLVFFYTPHGTVLQSWRPTGTESNFVLSPILQPLEPYHSKIIVLDGIGNYAVPGVPASTHENGPSVILTAHLGQPRPRHSDYFYYAGGPSLDDLLGRIGPTTGPGSAQLGVQTQAALQATSPILTSFKGAELSLEPTNHPADAYLSLMGQMAPAAIKSINADDNANFPIIAKIQMETLVQGLMADRTRAATIMLSDDLSKTQFTWLGPAYTSTYHAMAEASGGASRDQFIAVQTWLASQFAYLLDKLDATPEGAGTLLDNTLVVWLSDTGEASTHSGLSIPVVLAGNVRGTFKTGRYVHVDGRSQADLLVTIARAFGIATLGDPAFNPAPLTQLYSQ